MQFYLELLLASLPKHEDYVQQPSAVDQKGSCEFPDNARAHPATDRCELGYVLLLLALVVLSDLMVFFDVPVSLDMRDNIIYHAMSSDTAT